MIERSTHHDTFVIERTYSAAPSRVFLAWADPASKARWFVGGADWTQIHREHDFRVGGRERLQGRRSGGQMTSYDAVYRDIVADERIIHVYDMHLDDTRISISLASVEFKSSGRGTRLIYTEQAIFLDGYDDAGSRERGTRALLDQLESELRHAAG